MAKSKENKHIDYTKIKQDIENKILILEEKLAKVKSDYLKTGKKLKAKNSLNTKKLDRLSTKERKLEARIQKYKIDLIHIEENTYKKKNFLQKILSAYKSLSYKNQKIVCGIILLLPWFIGFCIFFAKPLITTIVWSFNEVTPQAGKVSLKFIGIKNYIDLFKTQMLGSRTFLEVLTVSIEDMILNVPIICIFSLIIAVILNSKFRGHQLFKAIFFIPVIYNTTAIAAAIDGAFGGHMSSTMSETTDILSGFSNYLLNIGLGKGLIEFLIGAVNRIFTIVNKSGIQILIFIAALQSIPPHLYEAAKVEGATTYECFWKITFPMVSSMFLPVIIYSIVDSFVSSDLIQIMTVNSTGSRIAFGMSSTIAIVYFAVNLIIIGVIFALLRKVVYTHD